jgi:hypothetical protein
MDRLSKDVAISEKVYWKLCAMKFAGKYRSIDEALRPLLDIPPGERPHVKRYTRVVD